MRRNEWQYFKMKGTYLFFVTLLYTNQRTEGTEGSAIKKTFDKEAVLV